MRTIRVAFISLGSHEYSRRLARGVSRFASPANGLVTRDFLLGADTTDLPPSFGSWSPDAVVSFIPERVLEQMPQLSEQALPIVSASRAQTFPNRAVILGDAEEVYRCVHKHFEEIGIGSIWQFSLGEGSEPGTSKHRYREYAATQGLTFQNFTAEDPQDLEKTLENETVDPQLADWLVSLPKPVGVFTQNSYAGQYLSRSCELLGISVPEEVAIIGSDGFDVATASTPQVTSIRPPAEEIGYQAAKIAVAMLKGESPPQEIIRVGGLRLVVRQSTRPRINSGCDIDAAMDFMDLHACEGIKVNDVISHTQGVSRVTFHKRFFERTGKTPGHALLDRKLYEARRLLRESEISAGAIAAMCGYQDYLHFYRTFRKAEGVSPSEFRKLIG